MKLKLYLAAWWKLSRVPFLSVGILPLILGFVLAWRGGSFGGLHLLAMIAVVLIMWMTYYLSEWNDLEGDRNNSGYNRFSGGSRVLVKGMLPPWIPLLLGYGCLLGAILMGIYIFFHYKTGPWTLPLGGFGILSGFFYSIKPFRWAYRGLGEILVAICYGWLPIATGFYLFTGSIGYQVFLLSIPVGLSIFNVILMNEFPDEEADRSIGKRNLLVRYGKGRMADLSLGILVLNGLSFVKVISVSSPMPHWLMFLPAIPLLLMVWNFILIWQKGYWDGEKLRILCRNSLLINLSVTMILTIQQTLNVSTSGR
jgi:1,4-dihydroxy-2-naphthoate polyprenyltransferase